MAFSLISKRSLPMWFLLLQASGCGFVIELHGSALVNPENPVSGEVGQSSRELSIRIYQLKRHDNVNQTLAIPWDAFTGTEIPEQLKPFLVVPADTPTGLRPQEDFYIRHDQHRRIPYKLAKGASALLVVARGGQSGELSLQLVPLELFDRQVSLCFHKFDVFQNPLNWPCAKGGFVE